MENTGNTTRKRNLRADMPLVTAWIDEMREAFGDEGINQSIKDGLDGEPTFWARENGIEVGTRSHEEGVTPTIITPVEIQLNRNARNKGGR